MSYYDGFAPTLSFRLVIEREDRGILNTTITTKADAAGITKAKKTLRRLLDEYAPLPPATLPDQDIMSAQPLEAEDRVPAEPSDLPEPEGHASDAAQEQTGQPEENPAPAAAPGRPPEGAAGVLRLHCRECGRTFGTFLKERQRELTCRCGHQIDLTAPLARYRFTCPYCGKEGWGQTNLEDPDITVRCKCGGDANLRWNPKAREYQN